MNAAKENQKIDISSLSKGRLLCIGDVMLDRFVTGVVERVSREAPIPVLRVTDETSMLGGAGNVARNLSALGVMTDFLCVIGDDDISTEIATLLARENHLTPHIVTRKKRPGTLKIRYVCNKQQMLRVDQESDLPIGRSDAHILLEKAVSLMPDCGGLIISDYGKGLLSPDILAVLIAKSREHGLPVIVDPRGVDYAIYAGADIIKPNRDELAAASGLPVEDDQSVVAAARRLIDDFDFRAVLATRGEQGATLVRADDRMPVHLRSSAREIFDVSGAGDTVIAVVAAGLVAGFDLEEGVSLANMVAGMVVAKAGTAVVTTREIEAEIARMQSGGRPDKGNENKYDQEKLFSLDDLLTQVKEWRHNGMRIGFTNGCFDLLHPGHVSLLHQARAVCDHLIVGLNTDHSVRRLKGKTRPIQSESARANVLAALSMVDAVVTFDEDTPLTLIEALRPDVLIKGKDYTLAQVVGADIVQSYGGKIFLAELQPGYSTTKTVHRLVP